MKIVEIYPLKVHPYTVELQFLEHWWLVWPWTGDSDENRQNSFVLKQIENISLLCLRTRRYDQHSLARTTLSRTYFHGSEGVQAIEDLLYIYRNSNQF